MFLEFPKSELTIYLPSGISKIFCQTVSTRDLHVKLIIMNKSLLEFCFSFMVCFRNALTGEADKYMLFSETQHFGSFSVVYHLIRCLEIHNYVLIISSSSFFGISLIHLITNCVSYYVASLTAMASFAFIGLIVSRNQNPMKIEDITWPRGDTKVPFQCWKIFHAWLKIQVIEISSKCEWSDCVQCIPFILRGSPNEGGCKRAVYP